MKAPELEEPLYEISVITNQMRVGEPTVSWWLDAPRDGFAEAARREHPRMQTSRFGKLVRLVGNFT